MREIENFIVYSRKASGVLGVSKMGLEMMQRRGNVLSFIDFLSMNNASFNFDTSISDTYQFSAIYYLIPYLLRLTSMTTFNLKSSRSNRILSPRGRIICKHFRIVTQ